MGLQVPCQLRLQVVLWYRIQIVLCHLAGGSTRPLADAATGGVVLLDTDHVVSPVNWVYRSPVTCGYRWCCVAGYRLYCVPCQLMRDMQSPALKNSNAYQELHTLKWFNQMCRYVRYYITWMNDVYLCSVTWRSGCVLCYLEYRLCSVTWRTGCAVSPGIQLCSIAWCTGCLVRPGVHVLLWHLAYRFSGCDLVYTAVAPGAQVVQSVTWRTGCVVWPDVKVCSVIWRTGCVVRLDVQVG